MSRILPTLALAACAHTAPVTPQVAPHVSPYPAAVQEELDGVSARLANVGRCRTRARTSDQSKHCQAFEATAHYDRADILASWVQDEVTDICDKAGLDVDTVEECREQMGPEAFADKLEEEDLGGFLRYAHGEAEKAVKIASPKHYGIFVDPERQTTPSLDNVRLDAGTLATKLEETYPGTIRWSAMAAEHTNGGEFEEGYSRD